jgi:RNA polymerase sigma factor (sigma-70 family)
MTSGVPPQAIAAPPSGASLPPGDASDAEALIKSCLVEHADLLLRRAYLYIVQAGLCSGSAARDLARDLFQNLTVQALQSAPRFNPSASRGALPWLKKILLHLVLQVRGERYRHPRVPVDPDDGEAFDWLARHAGLADPPSGAEEDLSTQQQTEQLLCLLEPDHREVVELSVLCELDGRETARRLGITPAAARTRLCRALERLRHRLPGRMP